MKKIKITCDLRDSLKLSEFADLQPDNFKEMSKNSYQKFRLGMLKAGFHEPIKVWHDNGVNYIVDGHHRIKILKEFLDEGYKIPLIPCYYVECDNRKDAIKVLLASNSHYAIMTSEGLNELLVVNEIDLDIFDTIELAGHRIDTDIFLQQFHLDANVENEFTKLTDRFIVPPFTILDTRQGYWQERKKAWLGLGIKGELGRGGQLLGLDKAGRWKEDHHQTISGADTIMKKGTSIFDPVLCEIIYTWFCIKKGRILDPFSGGSVRGIVANYMGYKYTGVDLSQEQIKANYANWKEIEKPDKSVKPEWRICDSANMDKLINKKYDLIFSCPPYHNLEVYSDNINDISNMDYENFSISYKKIIKNSVDLLKEDSFACFVVGDIRDKKGFYRGLVADTHKAFKIAGIELYNEAILINTAGSLPIRINKQFQSGRKLGKCHQNVLIYYKGNPKHIKEKFGTVEVDTQLMEVVDG